MASTTSCTSVEERPGGVTFRGKPLTLVGPKLAAGAKAPAFEATGQDLAPVTLADFSGKTLLISVTPSLDTPVCDLQAKRFNEEAATLSNVTVLNISVDLPFAIKRWCEATGSNRIQAVSDHKDASFGTAYGTLIKELRLLTRAIFVIDGGGTVRYVEYVPEMTSPPNYDAALEAVKKL